MAIQNPEPTPVDDALVAELMIGAADLHCHSGPSVMARKLNHADAVRQAKNAGMRAVLFKDHYYPTAPVAELLKEMMGDDDFAILSGVTLNNHVGGLNPYAVEHGLKLGARLVWMPTISAANHLRHGHRKRLLPTKVPMNASTALTVVDAQGRLVDEVKAILDLIAEHDCTLATGHLHISEIWPLLTEFKHRGGRRMLINHPEYLIEASLADMKELAGMGAYLEHSICQVIDCPSKKFSGEELRGFIEAATVEKTIFGSDMGQMKNPFPVDGFREVIRVCLRLGYGEDAIRRMVGQNACDLIGLSPLAAETAVPRQAAQ
ncbi:DUF6282 family protein [Aquabacter spiritensis]|uniref:Amidohydrolase family protein n=1 Tax=Aquabacter spiritensis TaxID=933073 RepID=A0A4R3LSP1_9HYPH|nr:DUF6282 family protein [Aquabacter spiritensis]TCT03594.1 hypothetical protein EDC64_109144 [Aquabacter spiritensis]